MAELNIPLEVFGQQPGLNGLYTQICNFHPVEDASEYPTIIKTLQIGLHTLATSFPWIAGQTVNEFGIVTIKALERTPRLIVKDLRDDPSVADYGAFRQAGFPFSMLDESLICPRNTLPTVPIETPQPVFLVQANFIKGGILMCFVGQHNCMDMTGQGQMIYLLTKACRNEPFNPEELRIGNLDRKNLVPLLEDSYESGLEVERQIIKPRPPTAVSSGTGHIPIPPPAAVKSVWSYFIFSGTSLTDLKKLAINTLPSSSNFVSTDDALTALIWKAVSRARLARLDGTKTSIFARAIDARTYLNIPSTYPGILTNMAYNDSTLQTVADEPLGSLAAQLRSVLDPNTSGIGYRTRALASLIARSEDKSQYNITANMDFGSDIMLSSWSKVDSYNDDFGFGLGKPEAVRRPLFPGVESLMYLMPKTADGEVAAALCLREEDMERLRQDEEFTKFGQIRLIGGAVATNIYVSIYTSWYQSSIAPTLRRLTENTGFKGRFPERSKATTANTAAAYAKVQGINPQTVQAAVLAVKTSYMNTFWVVCLVAIGFGICVIASARSTRSVRKENKNNAHAVRLETEKERDLA